MRTAWLGVVLWCCCSPVGGEVKKRGSFAASVAKQVTGKAVMGMVGELVAQPILEAIDTKAVVEQALAASRDLLALQMDDILNILAKWEHLLEDSDFLDAITAIVQRLSGEPCPQKAKILAEEEATRRGMHTLGNKQRYDNCGVALGVEITALLHSVTLAWCVDNGEFFFGYSVGGTIPVSDVARMAWERSAKSIARALYETDAYPSFNFVILCGADKYAGVDVTVTLGFSNVASGGAILAIPGGAVEGGKIPLGFINSLLFKLTYRILGLKDLETPPATSTQSNNEVSVASRVEGSTETFTTGEPTSTMTGSGRNTISTSDSDSSFRDLNLYRNPPRPQSTSFSHPNPNDDPPPNRLLHSPSQQTDTSRLNLFERPPYRHPLLHGPLHPSYRQPLLQSSTLSHNAFPLEGDAQAPAAKGGALRFLAKHGDLSVSFSAALYDSCNGYPSSRRATSLSAGDAVETLVSWLLRGEMSRRLCFGDCTSDGQLVSESRGVAGTFAISTGCPSGKIVATADLSVTFAGLVYATTQWEVDGLALVKDLKLPDCRVSLSYDPGNGDIVLSAVKEGFKVLDAEVQLGVGLTGNGEPLAEAKLVWAAGNEKETVSLRSADGLSGPSLSLGVRGRKMEVTGYLPLTVCLSNCHGAQEDKELLVFEGQVTGGLESGRTSVHVTLKMIGWLHEAFGVPILHIGNIVMEVWIDLMSRTPDGLHLEGEVKLGGKRTCSVRPRAKGCVHAKGKLVVITKEPEQNEMVVMVQRLLLEDLWAVLGEVVTPLRSVSLPRPLARAGIKHFPSQIDCAQHPENETCFAVVAYKAGELQVSGSINFGVGSLALDVRVILETPHLSLKIAGEMDFGVVAIREAIITMDSSGGTFSLTGMLHVGVVDVTLLSGSVKGELTPSGGKLHGELDLFGVVNPSFHLDVSWGESKHVALSAESFNIGPVWIRNIGMEVRKGPFIRMDADVSFLMIPGLRTSITVTDKKMSFEVTTELAGMLGVTVEATLWPGNKEFELDIGFFFRVPEYLNEIGKAVEDAAEAVGEAVSAAVSAVAGAVGDALSSLFGRSPTPEEKRKMCGNRVAEQGLAQGPMFPRGVREGDRSLSVGETIASLRSHPHFTKFAILLDRVGEQMGASQDAIGAVRSWLAGRDSGHRTYLPPELFSPKAVRQLWLDYFSSNLKLNPCGKQLLNTAIKGNSVLASYTWMDIEFAEAFNCTDPELGGVLTPVWMNEHELWLRVDRLRLAAESLFLKDCGFPWPDDCRDGEISYGNMYGCHFTFVPHSVAMKNGMVATPVSITMWGTNDHDPLFSPAPGKVSDFWGCMTRQAMEMGDYYATLLRMDAVDKERERAERALRDLKAQDYKPVMRIPNNMTKQLAADVGMVYLEVEMLEVSSDGTLKRTTIGQDVNLRDPKQASENMATLRKAVKSKSQETVKNINGMAEKLRDVVVDKKADAAGVQAAVAKGENVNKSMREREPFQLVVDKVLTLVKVTSTWSLVSKRAEVESIPQLPTVNRGCEVRVVEKASRQMAEDEIPKIPATCTECCGAEYYEVRRTITDSCGGRGEAIQYVALVLATEAYSWGVPSKISYTLSTFGEVTVSSPNHTVAYSESEVTLGPDHEYTFKRFWDITPKVRDAERGVLCTQQAEGDMTMRLVQDVTVFQDFDWFEKRGSKTFRVHFDRESVVSDIPIPTPEYSELLASTKMRYIYDLVEVEAAEVTPLEGAMAAIKRTWLLEAKGVRHVLADTVLIFPPPTGVPPQRAWRRGEYDAAAGVAIPFAERCRVAVNLTLGEYRQWKNDDDCAVGRWRGDGCRMEKQPLVSKTMLVGYPEFLEFQEFVDADPAVPLADQGMPHVVGSNRGPMPRVWHTDGKLEETARCGVFQMERTWTAESSFEGCEGVGYTVTRVQWITLNLNDVDWERPPPGEVVVPFFHNVLEEDPVPMLTVHPSTIEMLPPKRAGWVQAEDFADSLWTATPSEQCTSDTWGSWRRRWMVIRPCGIGSSAFQTVKVANPKLGWGGAARDGPYFTHGVTQVKCGLGVQLELGDYQYFGGRRTCSPDKVDCRVLSKLVQVERKIPLAVAVADDIIEMRYNGSSKIRMKERARPRLSLPCGMDEGLVAHLEPTFAQQKVTVQDSGAMWTTLVRHGHVHIGKPGCEAKPVVDDVWQTVRVVPPLRAPMFRSRVVGVEVIEVPCGGKLVTPDVVVDGRCDLERLDVEYPVPSDSSGNDMCTPEKNKVTVTAADSCGGVAVLELVVHMPEGRLLPYAWACRVSCRGYTCEELKNRWFYSCPVLERDYGCDCFLCPGCPGRHMGFRSLPAELRLNGVWVEEGGEATETNFTLIELKPGVFAIDDAVVLGRMWTTDRFQEETTMEVDRWTETVTVKERYYSVSQQRTVEAQYTGSLVNGGSVLSVPSDASGRSRRWSRVAVDDCQRADVSCGEGYICWDPEPYVRGAYECLPDLRGNWVEVPTSAGWPLPAGVLQSSWGQGVLRFRAEGVRRFEVVGKTGETTDWGTVLLRGRSTVWSEGKEEMGTFRRTSGHPFRIVFDSLDTQLVHVDVQDECVVDGIRCEGVVEGCHDPDFEAPGTAECRHPEDQCQADPCPPGSICMDLDLYDGNHTCVPDISGEWSSDKGSFTLRVMNTVPIAFQLRTHSLLQSTDYFEKCRIDASPCTVAVDHDRVQFLVEGLRGEWVNLVGHLREDLIELMHVRTTIDQLTESYTSVLKSPLRDGVHFELQATIFSARYQRPLEDFRVGFANLSRGFQNGSLTFPEWTKDSGVLVGWHLPWEVETYVRGERRVQWTGFEAGIGTLPGTHRIQVGYQDGVVEVVHIVNDVVIKRAVLSDVRLSPGLFPVVTSGDHKPALGVQWEWTAGSVWMGSVLHELEPLDGTLVWHRERDECLSNPCPLEQQCTDPNPLRQFDFVCETPKDECNEWKCPVEGMVCADPFPFYNETAVCVDDLVGVWEVPNFGRVELRTLGGGRWGGSSPSGESLHEFTLTASARASVRVVRKVIHLGLRGWMAYGYSGEVLHEGNAVKITETYIEGLLFTDLFPPSGPFAGGHLSANGEMVLGPTDENLLVWGHQPVYVNSGYAEFQLRALGKLGNEPFDDVELGFYDPDTAEKLVYGNVSGWSTNMSLVKGGVKVLLDRRSGVAQVWYKEVWEEMDLELGVRGPLNWEEGDVRVQVAIISPYFDLEVVVLLNGVMVMRVHALLVINAFQRSRLQFGHIYITTRNRRQLWRVAHPQLPYAGVLRPHELVFPDPLTWRRAAQTDDCHRVQCGVGEVCQDPDLYYWTKHSALCQASLDECGVNPCAPTEVCLDTNRTAKDTVECFEDLTGTWFRGAETVHLLRNGYRFEGQGLTVEWHAGGWRAVRNGVAYDAAYSAGSLEVRQQPPEVWTRREERDVAMLEWLEAHCPGEEQTPVLEEQIRVAVATALTARRVDVRVVCGSVTAMVVVEGSLGGRGAVAAVLAREVEEHAGKYPLVSALGAVREGKGTKCTGEHATESRMDHRGVCHAVVCMAGYAQVVDKSAKCIPIPDLSGAYRYRGEDSETVTFSRTPSHRVFRGVAVTSSPAVTWMAELHTKGARWAVRVVDLRTSPAKEQEGWLDASGSIVTDDWFFSRHHQDTVHLRLNTTVGSPNTFRCIVTAPTGHTQHVLVEGPQPGVRHVSVAWGSWGDVANVTLAREEGASPWQLYSVDLLQPKGYVRLFPPSTARTIDRWAISPDDPHSEAEVASMGSTWVRHDSVVFVQPENYTLLIPP